MIRHPQFGVIVPDLGWFPGPTYLLRRARVLDLVQELPPGRLLEVGCGAGALLDDFSRMGWNCDALEISELAIEIARSIHRGNQRVTVHSSPSPGWSERFRLVAAFEVLEHVENDLGALQQWTEWVSPGGWLILSVPAHRKRWGPSDVWAGHFRRYDIEDLLELITNAGLELERWECYGFPLANLASVVRSGFHRRRLEEARRGTPYDRVVSTSRSGIDRTLEARLFPFQARPPGSWLIRLLLRAQKRFLNRPWGGGYLVLARKPGGDEP